MTEALELNRPGPSDLQLWKQPEQVLSEAKQACDALIKILKTKAKPVMFNGEQYIEFEDWQILGQFYGYVPKIEATEHVHFLDYDTGAEVQGFKATAVLIYERTGEVISRAESMCLNNEEQWGKVTAYEWKDRLDAAGKKIWDATLFKGKGGYVRDKVETGTKSKPLFQIMSMAQTRACAKVMRNKLSWVVVMAGFKATPAEELDHVDSQDDDQQTSGKSSKKGSSVKCEECKAEGGHLPKCSHRAPAADAKTAEPKTVEAKQEPAKQEKAATGSATQEFLVLVQKINERTSKAGQKYLILDVVGQDKVDWSIFCWHQGVIAKSAQAHALGRVCRLAVSSKDKNGTPMYSLEGILEVAGMGEFVENQPAKSPSDVDEWA